MTTVCAFKHPKCRFGIARGPANAFVAYAIEALSLW